MKVQIAFYEKNPKYEIDFWDLNELINAEIKVIIIDARSADLCENEPIMGAVNIPHRTMTLDRTSILDKTVLMVTYYNGIGCNTTTKGALNLSRLGFTVNELIGAIDRCNGDGCETQVKKGVRANTIQYNC